MSDLRSCVFHEFPIPEREYRAAPPAMWDEPTVSKARRPSPSRLRRRRKQDRFLLLILAGSMLFAAGFLLGQAKAESGAPMADTLSLLPEEPEPKGAVTVRTVPGAVAASTGGKETGGEDGVSQEGTFSPAEPEDPLFTLLPAGPAGPARAVPGEMVVSTGEKGTGGEDWRLILVNSEEPLPEGFAVPELTQLRNGHAVDSRAYPELQRMMDDCRAAGLDPLICSSYRSWEKQAELFEKKVQSFPGLPRAEAEALASEWVSRPGTSEHQAGLALDIVDKSYQLLDEGQADTAVQKWLMAHCAEYGFILRYPVDKSALTGVGYEPWHYRYVGVEAAREIMSRGICLEEYLADA